MRFQPHGIDCVMTRGRMILSPRPVSRDPVRRRRCSDVDPSTEDATSQEDEQTEDKGNLAKRHADGA